MIEDSRRHYTVQAIWRTCLGGFPVSEAALARLRRQYAASIRYMDDWLARLLEELDRSGRLDETLVIVTADHGENFGEGGLIWHGLSLDNRLIHVPFVAAGPGARDNGLDSLAGLPRFVAECAGLEDHPWARRRPPEGSRHRAVRSGRGAERARGAPDGDRSLGPRRTRARTVHDPADLRRLRPAQAAATRRSGAVDRPRRRSARARSEADRIDPPPEAEAFARLRAALEHPAATASRPFRAPAEPVVSDAERRDLEERMKLLGYL